MYTPCSVRTTLMYAYRVRDVRKMRKFRSSHSEPDTRHKADKLAVFLQQRGNFITRNQTLYVIGDAGKSPRTRIVAGGFDCSSHPLTTTLETLIVLHRRLKRYRDEKVDVRDYKTSSAEGDDGWCGFGVAFLSRLSKTLGALTSVY